MINILCLVIYICDNVHPAACNGKIIPLMVLISLPVFILWYQPAGCYGSLFLSWKNNVKKSQCHGKKVKIERFKLRILRKLLKLWNKMLQLPLFYSWLKQFSIWWTLSFTEKNVCIWNWPAPSLRLSVVLAVRWVGGRGDWRPVAREGWEAVVRALCGGWRVLERSAGEGLCQVR